jgi:hypothetical protein
MSETVLALKTTAPKLVWALRAHMCEMFVYWAIKVAPKGYIPSYVEVAVDMYQRGKAEAK